MRYECALPNLDNREHRVCYKGFKRITLMDISGNVVFEFIR